MEIFNNNVTIRYIRLSTLVYPDILNVLDIYTYVCVFDCNLNDHY